MHATAPSWLRHYRRRDLRSDLTAGLTIGAMLVPQAMAYALLAGLPPEIGLYASIAPLIAYALFGTSRQLAVGPVAIVSLLTASALAPLFEEGTAGYVSAAALLALMVGAVHLVLGFGRLGFVVDVLSHSVLVGFTAAAAIIIGFSQVKHLLGISIPRAESFHDSVADVVSALGDTHLTTLGLGMLSIGALAAIKRWAPRVPGALVVVVASTVAVAAFGLDRRGVRTVGEIPSSLPAFGLPDLDSSAIGSLATTALVITLVGFMESIAVAKVYARRHRTELDPDRELVGLGMANVAAGFFGGYPVTGGFSRTAVNDTAGARTQLASVVTAVVVLATLVFLTPLLELLPQAALGAIIVVAVANLVDVHEMRHIARVKRSDLVGLSVAFLATLAFGIEVGIVVAVVASMLVVFVRMSRPHSAELGRIPGTTNYRNVERFPEAVPPRSARVVRIDAAVSFANANHVRRLCLDAVAAARDGGQAVVVDCSGINDIDATGAAMLDDLVTDLGTGTVALHLADVKGPVRDVLHRAGTWHRLAGRVHATPHAAVEAIEADRRSTSLRRAGIDERPDPNDRPTPHDSNQHQETLR